MIPILKIVQKNIKRFNSCRNDLIHMISRYVSKTDRSKLLIVKEKQNFSIYIVLKRRLDRLKSVQLFNFSRISAFELIL